ncbi:uncharacterized protein [Halyomorpha halys]|uniref:uncharacterized protein n=1 Tax=Halyomorpha halys TaxID=286706 RepID=UPI0034D17B05
MSKQTRQYKFLEDINNIGEEFSEISDDEFSENEDILVANKNEFDSTYTDDEEENIVNVCSGRKRIRLLSSSEESEVEINEQNVANDGSVWQPMQVGGTPGRAQVFIFCFFAVAQWSLMDAKRDTDYSSGEEITGVAK